MLGAVLVFLAVVLAAPVHRYLTARNGVGQAENQLRASEAQLAELQQQRALWSDPGYVQQQARERLQYAMPGDTVYIVVRPGQQPSLGGTLNAPAGSTVTGTTWNKRLWGSVLSADAAP